MPDGRDLATTTSDVLRSTVEELSRDAPPGAPSAAGRRLNGLSLLTLMALGQRHRAAAGRNAPPVAVTPDLAEQVSQRLGGGAAGPLSRAELERGLELVRSGRAERDLHASLAVLLRTVARLPESLARDVLALPALPQDVIDAVRSDLAGLAGVPVADILHGISDGTIDERPDVLRNTLGVLLGRATTGSAVDALRTLIAPDNPTARLAILVYARSQGIDLTESELDALHTALDPTRPNAGPLLEAGLRRLRERSGGPQEFLEIVQRLTSA
ncbi:MAG TPA: hypothetical protein VFD92_10080 [Candidatus Binatia bacterium]|nr:hypothetical protein [Candidatus Binatia bacterium]